MDIKKGDRVEIRNDAILNECMGLDVATGKVFMVYEDDRGFTFQCEQTGCMEICRYDDGGEITVK